MDDFAWIPRTPGAGVPDPHFVSPRFTELTPAVQNAASGESPLIEVAPFDHAVLSWNGDGDGNWCLELRLRIDGSLTPYYALGEIQGTRQSSATGKGMDTRTPATAESVTVDLDTLRLTDGKRATAFQVRATGEGNLRMLAVAHYLGGDCHYTDRPATASVWGTTLAVAPRAQQEVEEEPEIGGIVCSPTALSMALEYHGSVYRTIDVCRAALDHASGIYGNWPCNTGAAARLLPGSWSAVVKMTGFDELEREIAKGRPVVLSHRWEREDLPNAPIPRSSGHLILVVGFTENGDVLVNDPAAPAAEGRRLYRRRELFHTWQELGQGIVYLLHPG